MLNQQYNQSVSGDLQPSPTIRSLVKICSGWEKRAQARTFELPNITLFDPNKEDYLDDLLPFNEHHVYKNANKSDRSNILSCGWLLYCQKTIEIEKHILTPACIAIYDLGDQLRLDHTAREVISQTLVDEAYHILMTHHVSQITRSARELDHIQIPVSSVVECMFALQDEHPEKWKKDLILIVTAIVTEVFICGHLKKNEQCPTCTTYKCHVNQGSPC